MTILLLMRSIHFGWPGTLLLSLSLIETIVLVDETTMPHRAVFLLLESCVRYKGK